MAIDASDLPNFTPRDLEYFKFLDVRDEPYEKWTDPAFFLGKQRTNPSRDALLTAISVLGKSAAALLVKRHLGFTPTNWKIYAAAYSGETDALDFDPILGETLPFDSGVKVWIRPLEKVGDWSVIYLANGVLVYFFFIFSENTPAKLLELFSDTDIHEFSGDSLNKLLTVGWKKV